MSSGQSAKRPPPWIRATGACSPVAVHGGIESAVSGAIGSFLVRIGWDEFGGPAGPTKFRALSYASPRKGTYVVGLPSEHCRCHEHPPTHMGRDGPQAV